MRYIEILVKLLFFVEAVAAMIAMNVTPLYLQAFLVTCMTLGIILIYNKDASYHFKQTKKDLQIRRVEGIILILFAVMVNVAIAVAGFN